jgi:hypothetical protein
VLRLAKQVNNISPKNRLVNRIDLGIDFLLKAIRTGDAAGQYTYCDVNARESVLKAVKFQLL